MFHAAILALPGARVALQQMFVFGRREHMDAARSQDPGNFSNGQIRPKNVFEHILGYEDIERVVLKGKPFQILAPLTILYRAEGFSFKVIRRSVLRTHFAKEVDAWRTFVYRHVSPIRRYRVEDLNRSSLAGASAASAAQIEIPQPFTGCDEMGTITANRTIALIGKHNWHFTSIAPQFPRSTERRNHRSATGRSCWLLANGRLKRRLSRAEARATKMCRSAGWGGLQPARANSYCLLLLHRLLARVQISPKVCQRRHQVRRQSVVGSVRRRHPQHLRNEDVDTMRAAVNFFRDWLPRR